MPYFVRTGGNDTLDGLSDATAWATVSKVNTFSFADGSIVQFRKGDTWRETLIPLTSGSLGLPITYTFYGTGNNPIISGANIWGLWTAGIGTYYSTSYTTKPGHVYMSNTVLLREVFALGELGSATWYWDVATSRLYVKLPGDANPNTVVIEGSARDYCVQNLLRTYLVIQTINFEKSKVANVLMQAQHNIVRDCKSRRSLLDGFVGRATDIRFETCVAQNNERYGIALTLNGAADGVVTNCTADHNGGHGINLDRQLNSAVIGGESSQNGTEMSQGDGLAIVGCTTCNVSAGFIASANFGHGIRVGDRSGTRSSGVVLDQVECYGNGHNTPSNILMHFEETDVLALSLDPDEFGEFTGFVYGHHGTYESTVLDLINTYKKRHFAYVNIFNYPLSIYLAAGNPWFDWLNFNVQLGIPARMVVGPLVGLMQYFYYVPTCEHPEIIDWSLINATWRTNIVNQLVSLRPTAGVFLDQAWLTPPDYFFCDSATADPTAPPDGCRPCVTGLPFASYTGIAAYRTAINAFYTAIDTAFTARKTWVLKNGEHDVDGGILMPGPLYLENSNNHNTRTWAESFTLWRTNDKSVLSIIVTTAAPDTTGMIKLAHAKKRCPAGWVALTGDAASTATMRAAYATLQAIGGPGNGILITENSIGCVINRATCYGNAHAGIAFQDGAESCLVRYSVAYENGQGFVHGPEVGTGCVYDNVLAYGNSGWMTGAGFDCSGSDTTMNPATIRNSIFYGNTLGMYLDGVASVAAHTVLSNCYYANTAAAVDVGGLYYTTTQIQDGTYAAATGRDLGSLGLDPLLVGNGNWRPADTSPVIDRGLLLGYPLDYYGVTVPIQDLPEMGIAEVFGVLAPPPPGVGGPPPSPPSVGGPPPSVGGPPPSVGGPPPSVGGPPPSVGGPPPPAAIPNVPAARVDLAQALGFAGNALNILGQDPNQTGFPAASQAMVSVYQFIDQALANLVVLGEEPPPPSVGGPPPSVGGPPPSVGGPPPSVGGPPPSVGGPPPSVGGPPPSVGGPPPSVGPPPPPPIPSPPSPTPPPLQPLPPLVARPSDLLGVVPGVGPWEGWLVGTTNVAALTGREGILGRGAQAVRAMRITYGARYKLNVKLDRVALTRPSAGTTLGGLASYGGQFVPLNRIVPNTPQAPNPYINLAPVQQDLVYESLLLELHTVRTDGLTVEMVNVVNGVRATQRADIREDGVFEPGIFTRVLLKVQLGISGFMYGQVRFSRQRETDTEEYGPVHEFELPVLPGTKSPWVWALLGSSDLPSGGWISYRDFSVDDRPWET